MVRYDKYLKYVLKHKWYVCIECWKDGLYWQGIIHDMSKLLPSEFFPYARHFYGKEHDDIAKGRKDGYYKPTDTGDKEFDFAWLLHQKRNRHHWQWWILPEDDGGLKILDMPGKYIDEMICDWQGAGKAQKSTLTTSEWYNKHKDKMQLSRITQDQLEMRLHLKDWVIGEEPE